MKLLFISFAALIFLLSVFSASANASQIHFDLNLPDTSGSIYFNGGTSNPLVGEDIPVHVVTGVGTPSNDGTEFDIINGLLDFQTGDLTSYSSSGGNQTWTFSGGGSLTITGTVDVDGEGDVDAGEPTGNLVYDGEFYSNIVLEMQAGSFEYWATIGSFRDSKNEDLVDLFGMPDGLYEGGFNISFLAEVTDEDTHAFQSTETQTGDLTNMLVPVPSAVWLLGSGLIAAVGVNSRKKFRK